MAQAEWACGTRSEAWGTGLLGAPVRVGNEDVGRVSALVADPGLERVLGLEVTGRRGLRLFLPWVAATIRAGEVHAPSRLVLFEAHEVDGYASRGARLVHDPRDVSRLAAQACAIA